MLAITPTQSNAQAALAAFLGAVLPGTSGLAPAVFVGTISGTTLTVTGLAGRQPAGIQGVIQPNSPLLGLGVAPGTIIGAPISGSGGIGTYMVSPSQTLSQPVTMSTGVTIIAGQQNRVAEPTNPYFVVFVPIRFTRLATNVDGSADCKFTGSIAGTTMTVIDVTNGIVQPGATVFGTGVSPSTKIIAQLSGNTGGAGTYQISPSQNVIAGTLSAGSKTLTQSAEIVIQLDFHSPDSLAGDFAQEISTALRDEYGVDFFAGLAPPLNGVVPFYADDAKMTPFLSGENQYEWRFSLDAKFQVDQVVVVPAEYSDSATIVLKDVSAFFPA